jgi:hypothetical protein
MRVRRSLGVIVLVAPLVQQAFIWGVKSRVEESSAGLIQGYRCAAPCEELKLR